MSACPRHNSDAMGPWDVCVPLRRGLQSVRGGPQGRGREEPVRLYVSALVNTHLPPRRLQLDDDLTDEVELLSESDES